MNLSPQDLEALSSSEVSAKLEALTRGEVLEPMSPAQSKALVEFLEKQLDIARVRQRLAEMDSAPQAASQVPAGALLESPSQAAAVQAAMDPAGSAVTAFSESASDAASAAVQAPTEPAASAVTAFSSSGLEMAAPAKEAAIAMAAPAKEAAIAMSASDAASIPWVAFLVAFTVFPTAVITVSKLMEQGPTDAAPPPQKPLSSLGTPVTASAVSSSNTVAERGADEIFLSAMMNLNKDPTGWFFGKPSPLYSNMPASVLPTPAPPVTLQTTDASGVVAPTTVAPKETPQERAARERQEMKAEGKQF